MAMMYETHWIGLSRPSWEREMDLHLSRHAMLRYWTRTSIAKPTSYAIE